MPTATHISIIGAGIAGLTVAHYLQRMGKQITLLEADSKTGGILGIRQKNGAQYERSANTLINTPIIQQLIHDLNLNSAVIPITNHNNRFILKNHQLHPVPTNPSSLFKSKLLNWTDKLKIIKEIVHAPSNQPEQSISTFFNRHFSQNFTNTLIDPFVSGVWAGDTHKLSLDACFPELKRIEKNTGSIFKSLLANKPKPSKIISFTNGTQQLIDALTQSVQNNLLLKQKIKAINFNSTKQMYEIRCTDKCIMTNHIILTTPIDQLTSLLQHLLQSTQSLQQLTSNIQYAPISSITLCYKKQAISHPLNGFGYLIPSQENAQILGCLFNSSMFPHTCHSDQTLLTCFIGGEQHPYTAELNADKLQEIAHAQVSKDLGIDQRALWSDVITWQRGIPQYHLGHQKRVEDIKELINPHAISLHGNWVNGIAIPKIITQSKQLATNLAQI